MASVDGSAIELELCYEGEPAPPTAGDAKEPLLEPLVAVDDLADTMQSTLTFQVCEKAGHEVSTELEVMWHRLSGRGHSVAERMNMNMHNGAAALECESRDEALIQAFRALDVRNTGSLGANALGALVALHDPQSNANQAKALLEEMDLDDDGKVSLTDWEKSWEPFKESSSDSAFFHAICAVVYGLNMPVDYDVSNPLPRYPDNNAEYLATNVSSLLQQGLVATLEFMMDNQIKVASRQLRDSDGFLPKSYKPPCAVRFLGEWLRAHKDVPPPEEENPLLCDWSSGVPEDTLTTTMKLKVAFLHLDRLQTGFVSIDDVRHLLESFTAVTTQGSVAQMIEAMDLFNLHDMNLEEFMELLSNAFQYSSIEQINSCLSLTLRAYFLSTLDTAQQVRQLFEHMANLSSHTPADVLEGARGLRFNPDDFSRQDRASLSSPDVAEPDRNIAAEDGSQGIDGGTAVCDGSDMTDLPEATSTTTRGQGTPEQPESLLCIPAPPLTPLKEYVVEWASVQAIVRRALQTYDPAQVAAVVGGIEVDRRKVASGMVPESAFADMMAAVYREASGLEMANEFAMLMNGAVELDPAKDLATGLREHVKNLPLYGTIAGASVAWVLQQLESEDVSEVIGVDCRSEEEFEVSTILQGILCEAMANPCTQYGYETDPEGLDEVRDAVQMSLDAPTDARPVVVVFCTDGSRSLVVAAQLLEHFASARIVALTGGMIAWNNARAPMEDADGNATTELHPGFVDELQEYILFPDENFAETEVPTSEGGVEAE